MNIIELKKISRIYSKKNYSVEALKQIDLQIKSGEMVAIMGTSGSGKSTLLNILGLIDTPTSGEYFLNEEKVVSISSGKQAKLRNNMFGFVLQDFALIERYNIVQNLRVPLLYSVVPKREWKSRIDNSLKKVLLQENYKKKPSELSGGQQQRVAIARAIVNDAEIILADEPTGALDSKTGAEIMRVFKKIKDTGRTIIIVTHDDDIAKQCDRILRLEDGELSEFAK
ncbi:MAG: ABC transporter ATP-binding protein [Anaerovoracaceae bacterium]